jgi:hypothetical protein
MSATTIGAIIAFATILILLIGQTGAIAFWMGGMTARLKSLEQDGPVATELANLLSGLIATVGGLKTAAESHQLSTSQRFDTLERRIETLSDRTHSS